MSVAEPPVRRKRQSVTHRGCTATVILEDNSRRACGNRPIPGGHVCRYHGGGAPQVREAARRRLVLAKAREEVAEARETLGGSRRLHPLEALLEVVHEAAANVAVLRMLVAEEKNTRALFDDRGRPYTNPVLEYYNEERDRLARFSKLCLDAGVDERQVRVSEMKGQVMANVIRVAIEATNPTPEQRDAALKAAANKMREVSETWEGSVAA